MKPAYPALRPKEGFRAGLSYFVPQAGLAHSEVIYTGNAESGREANRPQGESHAVARNVQFQNIVVFARPGA